MEKNRVLLVDDEPSIIRFLRGSLEAEGWKILTASDGVKALEVFNLENVDLVILDIMMPDISGLEVLRHIQRTEGLAKIPVIVVSAKCLPADIKTGLEAGASIYLTKPVDYLDLKQAVEKVLDT